MKNPWIEFVEKLDDTILVIKEEQVVIEKFNQNANYTFKVHSEIMPAPFYG